MADQNDTKRGEIPLSEARRGRNADASAYGETASRRASSLYAEGVRSRYAENGARSVYAEGIGAVSAYSESPRSAPIDSKSVKVAINVARAQVRSMSRLARLHHRLGRISDYLNKAKLMDW